jgi:hypothetical protein
VKSANEMVAVDYVVKGSTTLTTHADHSSETGTQIYNKLISTNEYDYMILQEQSSTPYTNYNNFKTAVTSLAKDAKDTQKHCEVRLYSTWAYQEILTEEYDTIPKLEEHIREQYIKCANDVANVTDVDFVGPAFTKVATDTAYENIPLYYSDNKHQSMYGAYLSACIHALSIVDGINLDNTDFYGAKLGQYISANDPTAQGPVDFGAGISESDAKLLIELAKETVKTYSINTDDDSEQE